MKDDLTTLRMEESSNLYLRTEVHHKRSPCDSGIDVSLISITRPFDLPTFTPRDAALGSHMLQTDLGGVRDSWSWLIFPLLSTSTLQDVDGRDSSVKHPVMRPLHSVETVFYVWAGMGTKLAPHARMLWRALGQSPKVDNTHLSWSWAADMQCLVIAIDTECSGL